MSARFLVGDVFDRMAELPDGSVDLIITSPPFLALRSYLPDDHPLKHREIGSEATPAAFLDVMLALSAEWRRLLSRTGSIAIEIGDTYAGSGGAGGDYNDGGLRDGQNTFDGSARRGVGRVAMPDGRTIQPNGIGNGQERRGDGWPLDKSLCGIPTLYTWSLAYGVNLLTGEPSPAGMWRIRQLKPWIRSNPPVGALGDKERPATSYITVATIARDRYFDLDGARRAHINAAHGANGPKNAERAAAGGAKGHGFTERTVNDAGSPPLDWWHHVDAVLDAVIDEMAAVKRRAGGGNDSPGKLGGASDVPRYTPGSVTVGARGVHLRRALERAGILRTVDALDVSPKGYSGAHYAVWPPELVRLLVQEMCPPRVCTTCGEPSRRIVKAEAGCGGLHQATDGGSSTRGGHPDGHPSQMGERRVATVGWSDCGHDNTWRPGVVLDPFAGSGTTLAVCSGMGRDSIGIDIDARNAELARERVGMFLDIDDTTPEVPQP